MDAYEIERVTAFVDHKIKSGKCSPNENGLYKIYYTFPGEDSTQRVLGRGRDAGEVALKIIVAHDKRLLKEQRSKEARLRFDKIAAEWYYSEIERGVCDKTNDSNAHIINDILLEHFGCRSINDITRQEIKDFLTKQGKKYRINMVKKIRDAFVGIYTYANDSGVTTYFPVNRLSVKTIKCLPPLDGSEKNPVTKKEFLDSLAVSIDDSQMILILSMLFIYGFRPVELVNLIWKNIDFDSNTIFVEVSKYTDALNHDPKLYQRYLPITPKIRELLKKELEESKTDYIFHKKNNLNQLDTSTLDGYFETLTRKLEILNGAKVKNNKIVEYVGIRHFSPYAFRRLRITEMQTDPELSDTIIDAFDGHALKGINGKAYTRFDYETHLKPIFNKYLKNVDEQLTLFLKEAEDRL